MRVRAVIFNSGTGQTSYGNYHYGDDHVVGPISPLVGQIGATHGVYNAVDYPGGPFWQSTTT